jgi:hypothetical protein
VDLYKQLCASLQQHNGTVAQGQNRAGPLKSINGAIACGTMVRFFKVREGKASDGWLKAWSALGLDMVNGDPSAALGAVERILVRIKEPGRRGNLGKM